MSIIMIIMLVLAYLSIGILLVNYWLKNGGKAISGCSVPLGVLFWPVFMLIDIYLMLAGRK